MMQRNKFTLIFFSLLIAINSYAQPGQPEVSSFTPIGSSNLVDLSTGDFSYNIPLMNVGGYPINIAYSSAITMDQEASMVGLGWNINAGAVKRIMRGIPDDFNGDLITKKMHVKDNITYGVTFSQGVELIGIDPKDLNLGLGVTLGMGVFYNNYAGIGFERVFSPTISAMNKKGGLVQIGMGFPNNSQSVETSVEPSFSVTSSDKKNSINISTEISNIEGVKGFTFKQDYIPYVGGVSLPISSSSFTPSSQMPFRMSSFTFTFKMGGKAPFIYPSLQGTGYKSKRRLEKNILQTKSYGYLHLDNANQEDILDINREKDNGYQRNTPNLPVPSLTHDIFSVSGQGVSGTYRAYRNDVGVIFDPIHSEISNSGSIGSELGGGSGMHLAVNPSYNKSTVKYKKWNKNNLFQNKVGFQSRSLNNPLFEPVYFKSIGEKSIMSTDLFDDFYSDRPICVALGINTLMEMEAKNNFIIFNKDYSKSIGISTLDKNLERAKRNQLFSYLTTAQASIKGATLNQKIRYVNEGYWLEDMIVTEDEREKDGRKAHHISQCEVLQDDGTRYVYDLPIYNTQYEEVSFSVCNTVTENTDACSGLVTYQDNDNSLDNSQGKDHYFEKKTIPAYSTSYLLTGKVSADYVDLLGDGITDDDLGTAVRFNYFRETNNYKWRIPFQKNTANYNEGFKSKQSDNKANYVYGEKELVYLQSIETKSHVAVFEYGKRRADGYEVKTDDGGIGDKSMRKLRSISLFSKVELKSLKKNAIPLKKVHFEYHYLLCQGVYNNEKYYDPSKNKDGDGEINQGGKLTLKKIYTTYRDQPKSKENPYVFSYGNNYAYNKSAVNRWGNYKEQTCTLNNTDFPYVNQIITNTSVGDTENEYASAWCMNKILTPSNSLIEVEYEADDYAYVQNKKAMQMTLIAGVKGKGDLGIGDQYLYDKYDPITHITNLPSPKNEITFKVAKDPDFEVKDHINSDTLYLRAFIDVTGDSDYEYVPCYLEIENALLDKNSDPTYDLLTLSIKNATTKDKSGKAVSPITKAAIQYSKIHLNDILTNQKEYCIPSVDDFDDKEIKQVIDNLADWIISNAKLFSNFISERVKKNSGRTIDLTKSYARLLNPQQKKIGGGSRVRQIKTHDNWGTMSQGKSTSTYYGTDYEYTTLEGSKIISSGVSSYEPQAGGDENPFRIPVNYYEKHPFAPDDKHTMEMPMGELHFPDPHVVYSKVTEKSLRNDPTMLYSTGRNEHEFYTAKDFPTITLQTSLAKLEIIPAPAMIPFVKKSRERVAVSQGYSIIKNDMHGKIKSQKIFAQGQLMPLSGTEYIYRTDEDGLLNNSFRVLNTDGSFSEKQIGVDYEMYVDMREQTTDITGGDISFNFDVEAFPPVITSIPIPTVVTERTIFNSSVFQKVIYKYGLVDSVIAFDNSSTIATKNLALDSETGNVLVTKTYNEFNDPIYNTNYPAHWGYPLMGSAYQNAGAFESIETYNNGLIKSGGTSLVESDEVLLHDINMQPYMKAWVYLHNSKRYLIDENGWAIASYNGYAFVLRSGYKNLLSHSIGQVKTTNYPNITDNLQKNKILDASVLEYKGNWKTYTSPSTYITDSLCSCELVEVHDLLSFLVRPTGQPLGTKGSLLDPKIYSSKAPYVYNFKTDDLSLGFWNKNHFIKCFNNNSPIRLQYWVNSWDPSLQQIEFSLGIQNCDSCNYVLTIDPPPDFTNQSIKLGTDRVWNILPVICDPNSCIIEFGLDSSINGQYNHKYTAKIQQISKSCPLKIGQCFMAAQTSLCHTQLGNTINPYKYGLLSNWKPKRDLLYLSNRKYSSKPSVKQDGLYKSFTSFWESPSNSNTPFTINNANKWKWKAETTLYDSENNSLETVDPLGKYSTQLRGYGNNLQIAASTNSRYKNLANDNFEDYSYWDKECQLPHLNFTQTNYNINNQESHTGIHSICLEGIQSSISVKRDITSSANLQPQKMPFELRKQDFIPIFNPDRGITYIISIWVKEASETYKTNYTETEIDVILSSGTHTFKPEGPMIEGWQRIYGEFKVENVDQSIEIILKKNACFKAFFDDLRIHPVKSSMVTYVYHPDNNKLMAQLDDANYATYYEYDQEGNLIRTKRETEFGIVTIQENRQHLSTKTGTNIKLNIKKIK